MTSWRGVHLEDRTFRCASKCSSVLFSSCFCSLFGSCGGSVCSRSVSVETGQKNLRADWTAARPPGERGVVLDPLLLGAGQPPKLPGPGPLAPHRRGVPQDMGDEAPRVGPSPRGTCRPVAELCGAFLHMVTRNRGSAISGSSCWRVRKQAVMQNYPLPCSGWMVRAEGSH